MINIIIELLYKKRGLEKGAKFWGGRGRECQDYSQRRYRKISRYSQERRQLCCRVWKHRLLDVS